MKILMISIAVFALGFYIGHYSTNFTSTIFFEPVTEKSNLLVENARLKSEIEKLTKTNVNPISSVPVQRNETEVSNTHSQQQPLTVDNPSLPITAANPQRKNWNAEEKNIPQIRSAAEISAFLRKVKIDDFTSELGDAKKIDKSDELIDYLNGNFVGTMAPEDQKAGFVISLNTAIQVQNQALRGRVSIRLARNGKTFSRSSNNGEIQSIQRFGQNSAAVILTSGDHHFQLYYIPQLDSFEGNCYQQVKPGTLKYVGTVHLERDRN